MKSNRFMTIIIVAILTVAIASYVIFSFSGQLDSDLDISDSSYIEIYYRQYAGFVPPEKAELEFHVSNNGNIRLVWINADGEITEGYNDEISREDLESLAGLMIENNYFALDERYTTPEGVIIADAGAADIIFKFNSKEKQVTIDPNVDDYLPQNLLIISDRIKLLVQQTIDKGISEPNKGRILGTVTFQDGVPGEEFRLGIVKGSAPFPEISPITDEEGEFQFPSLPPGTFIIALYDDEGEIIEQKSVSVKEGSTSTVKFIIPSIHPSEYPFQRLSWKKTGGFAGVNEEIIIAPDGSVLFLLDGSGAGSYKLNSSENQEIYELIEELTVNTDKEKIFLARSEAADYFNYQLLISIQNNEIEFKWVDSWASVKETPDLLEQLNTFIQKILTNIKNQIDDTKTKILGRVIIGPLCPVEPCQDPQINPYTSRDIIMIREDKERLIIPLEKDGSFEAMIEPGNYELFLSNCDFLECQSVLPIQVQVIEKEPIFLEITIDTGIR